MIAENKKKGNKVGGKATSKWNIFSKASAPSSAVQRPMKNYNSTIPEKKGLAKKLQKSDKNEIFVDIFEKLSVSLFYFILKRHIGPIQPKRYYYKQSNRRCHPMQKLPTR